MKPYLYNVTSKAALSDTLDAFYGCMELPIQLLDNQGAVLMQRGKQCNYCKHFITRLNSPNECTKIHKNAADYSMKLGEAYIFNCHSGLTHISFPLQNEDALLGAVIIGPFLMEEPDSSLMMDISKEHPEFNIQDLLGLYDDAGSLPIVEPSKVTHISNLMYFLFSNLMSDSKEQFFINRRRTAQQSKISETIHLYKNQDASDETGYPFPKEKQLISYIKEGNREAAVAALNDLLGYSIYAGGNNIEVLRARCCEICTMMSRSAAATGAKDRQVFKISYSFISKVHEYNSLEELCDALEEAAYAFMDCAYPSIPTVSGLAVRSAIQYIAENYPNPITLEDTARHVNLNSSYFSRLFKSATGSTFISYLNDVRIEESRRLLKETNDSVLDIAIAVGFEDQSYFTRVFKKKQGMTPSQYKTT